MCSFCCHVFPFSKADWQHIIVAMQLTIFEHLHYGIQLVTIHFLGNLQLLLNIGGFVLQEAK